MASGDVRISTALPHHPKTKKLIRRGGDGAAWKMVCLFLWVASNRPDGNLAGMSDEDIELSVDWMGDPGAFIAALCASGFIDGIEHNRCIHDWHQHNPWAATAGIRSEAGRKAASARWTKRGWNANTTIAHDNDMHNASNADAERMQTAFDDDAERMRNASDTDASGINPQCDDDASAMRAASKGNAPSPAPTPTPTPKEPRAKTLVQRTAARFEEFWSVYPVKKGRADAETKWRARNLDAIADLIIADVKARKAGDRQWLDGYAPHGSTYVNGKGWEDAIESGRDGGGSQMAGQFPGML